MKQSSFLLSQILLCRAFHHNLSRIPLTFVCLLIVRHTRLLDCLEIKMYFFSKVSVILPILALLLAAPTGTSAVLEVRDNNNNDNHSPTPILPFTLAAFQSPWPPGYNGSGSNGVSGVSVRAFGGTLWVNPSDSTPRTECGNLRESKCPPGNETVLWVDVDGHAWMVPTQAPFLQLNLIKPSSNNRRTPPRPNQST